MNLFCILHLWWSSHISVAAITFIASHMHTEIRSEFSRIKRMHRRYQGLIESPVACDVIRNTRCGVEE
jgi:hypothetical protein